MSVRNVNIAQQVGKLVQKLGIARVIAFLEQERHVDLGNAPPEEGWMPILISLVDSHYEGSVDSLKEAMERSSSA